MHDDAAQTPVGALAQEVPAEAVLAALARILASSTFANAPILRRFLKHVVEHTIDGSADQLKEYVDLIKDEVNVKNVELTTDLASHGTFEITVNARAAGPRLGKDVQRVIKAVKANLSPIFGLYRDEAGVTARALDLVPEVVAGATPSGPGRVAALNDEALDHPMEDHAVVVAVAGQEDEVVHGAGRPFGIEVDDDLTVGGVEGRPVLLREVELEVGLGVVPLVHVQAPWK